MPVEMNIPLITKNKTMPQVVQETGANTVKETRNEGTEKSSAKNRVDSSEISGCHLNAFEDKRLSSFKAGLLYELSSDLPGKQVEALKEMVQNGSYKVDDEDLAKALLGD
jgi:anti-sigma28 factor (negative regulator of flagellin synthesis)